jgi:hypothetical protein
VVIETDKVEVKFIGKDLDTDSYEGIGKNEENGICHVFRMQRSKCRM